MVIFTSFYSCNKNCETNFVDSFNLDTIQPSAYLGAYPGSWREYDNGNRDECTAWESVPKYTRVFNSDGCTQIFRDYIIVPKVNEYYVDGDFILITDQSSNSSSSRRIVGNLGVSWGNTENFDEGTWGPGHETHSWSIDSLLDFKEVNGVVYEDVLFIRYSYSIYYDHNFGGPPPDISHYYYAKDIGLIQYKYFDYYGEEFPPNVEYALEDYYIAPH
jgi:hypothetical protein